MELSGLKSEKVRASSLLAVQRIGGSFANVNDVFPQDGGLDVLCSLVEAARSLSLDTRTSRT